MAASGLTGESPRAAGILLAVSSLPSPYGIGSFGGAAREWIRFLKTAGQTYWQILPLGPTGWGDSPYQSFSAFAISPYYVDLDTLIDEGLLSGDEV
ncbi:MAG: 4-alpha-glucanotransferase, partial [Treponema sp.]|nr:4-alpha-glucanotransferase [Treponema sp.]